MAAFLNVPSWLPSLGGWRSISRAELLTFALAFVTIAFFTEPRVSANFLPRILLAKSIIERGELSLEADRHLLSVDRSIYRGQTYSDRHLGSTLLMLPQYALIGRPAEYLTGRFTDLSDGHVLRVSGLLVRLASVAVFSAFCIALLARIFSYLELRAPLRLAMLALFATLLGAYSTRGTGEMFTAPWILLGCWYLLFSRSGRRGLWGGTSFALAGVVTYQAMLLTPVAVLFVLVTTRRLREALAVALPAAVATAMILFYNYLCFDSPFTFPSDVHANPSVPGESLQLVPPSLERLAAMLVLPWKGLFFFSPFLLLALPGSLRMRRDGHGAAVILLGSCVAVYFGFLLCLQGWTGGADYGFRYIVPVVPLLAIPACYWLGNHTWPRWAYLLVGVSLLHGVAGLLIDGQGLGVECFPLRDEVWPYVSTWGTNNLLNDVARIGSGVRSVAFRCLTSALFLTGLAALIGRGILDRNTRA